MVSVWMTAIAANYKIKIRFADDNTNCTRFGNTTNWMGYWFTNQR